MLIAVSGPSAIGKGYIKDRLIERYSTLRELPWLTTRPLRSGETPGQNRIHVTQARFDELVALGECVLVQQLYGHSYGLQRQYLQPSAEMRLTEIHPENVGAAIQLYPAIVIVGLITDDYGLLEERLEARLEGPEVAKLRLAAAKEEIEAIKRQSNLFRLVVTVSRETTITATNQAVEAIVQILESKGD